MSEVFNHHATVLLQEAVDALQIRSDGIYVDGTFGRGGHSGLLLDRLGADGQLYALDKDATAVSFAQQRFIDEPRFHIDQGNFAGLGEIAERHGINGRVDGLLLDLGMSSPQLDDAQRGFSFQHDGPLDMRMDTRSGLSAAEWLATAETDDISRVLRDYGEERYARRIARAIVAERALQPILTTGRLAEVVKVANPAWEKHKHPATRSFQAIRIFINAELDDLRVGLQQSLEVLAVGARLVVISFHSLEDRIVKRFMRDAAKGEQLPRGVPVRAADLQPPKLKLIGKALKPGAAEVEQNPRARSAVMRVAEVMA